LSQELFDLLVEDSRIVVIILEHKHFSCIIVLLSIVDVLLGSKLVGNSRLMTDFLAHLFTFLGYEAARNANLESSQTFVTSEHPDADTSIAEVLNALLDVLLKQIFDGSSSQECQVTLNLIDCEIIGVPRAIPLDLLHTVEERAETLLGHGLN